ncbi:hypothetical protein BKA93DRAFT_237993 [Sparassis latifolia]
MSGVWTARTHHENSACREVWDFISAAALSSWCRLCPWKYHIPVILFVSVGCEGVNIGSTPNFSCEGDSRCELLIHVHMGIQAIVVSTVMLLFSPALAETLDLCPLFELSCSSLHLFDTYRCEVDPSTSWHCIVLLGGARPLTPAQLSHACTR